MFRDLRPTPENHRPGRSHGPVDRRFSTSELAHDSTRSDANALWRICQIGVAFRRWIKQPGRCKQDGEETARRNPATDGLKPIFLPEAATISVEGVSPAARAAASEFLRGAQRRPQGRPRTLSGFAARAQDHALHERVELRRSGLMEAGRRAPARRSNRGRCWSRTAGIR